jgi:hypothetical protein
MKNEISPDRLITFLPTRAFGTTRIIRGPLKGLAGRAFQLGRDGRLLIQTPPPSQSEHFVVLDIDWLDTDLASRMTRAAYRARRAVVRTPHEALSAWSRLLPERVLSEDLADFLERVQAAHNESRHCSAFVISVQGIFWTAVNSVRFVSGRG